MKTTSRFFTTLAVIFLAAPVCMGVVLQPRLPIKTIDGDQYLKSQISYQQSQIAADRASLRRLAGRSGVQPQRNKLLRDITIHRRRRNVLQSALRAGTTPKFSALSMVHLRVGQIGRISDQWSLREILNQKVALGCDYYFPEIKQHAPIYLYHRPTFQNIWFAVKGFDLSGLATPMGASIHCVCLVSGTMSYTSVLGARRTVFVLTPIQLKIAPKKAGK